MGTISYMITAKYLLCNFCYLTRTCKAISSQQIDTCVSSRGTPFLKMFGVKCLLAFKLHITISPWLKTIIKRLTKTYVLIIGKQPIRTQYQVFEFLGISINCYGRHPLLFLPGISLYLHFTFNRFRRSPNSSNRLSTLCTSWSKTVLNASTSAGFGAEY